ncbi:MAG: VOC family protein [Rhodospirillaceae bacterium]|nr:VOC family protein [Rhodospirillaceae bacterium]
MSGKECWREDDEMKRYNYRGVDHVHINVTDLDRAIDFYTGTLGFAVAGRRDPDKAWLNSGQYPESEPLWYHNLALTEVPERNDRYWSRTGLNHVAFELESPEDVMAIGDDLKRRGVRIIRGPGVHAEDMTYHVYVEDPDGNVIELMARTDDTHAELRESAEWAPPPGWTPADAD